MMQGPIQRTVRHRIEPRADARLPTVWIGGTTGVPMWTDGAWLSRTPSRAASAGNAPFLALLGKGSEDARAELLARAGAGARAYALVGPEWGKDQTDNQLLQTPRVLFRRLSEVPASAVHFGAEARLWIGGGGILRLDATQSEALRQTFLRLFWHEATEEAWSGGRQFVWRPAHERPFDVSEMPSSASVRLEPADARLAGDSHGALMHVSAGLPPDCAPRRLWFPAGPDHHERLGKLAQAGVEVLWSNRGLPDIQVNGDDGEVLLPGTRGRLRLRLTVDQAAEAGRLLEAEPEWRFRTNMRLGEARVRPALFWLPSQGEARELEAEQFVKIPEVHASSLREVPDTEPASVPAAQSLALAVRYQWTVVPPRVPAGAHEDPLVGHWRRIDQEWGERLNKLLDSINRQENERGRIEKAFSHLAGEILGFQHAHKELSLRVPELKEQRPSSVGSAKTVSLFNQLMELEERVRRLGADTEAAERKAQEDAERKRQEQEWNRRVDEAKMRLPAAQQEHDVKKQRLENIDSRLSEIEAERRTAEKGRKRDLHVEEAKLKDERNKAEKEIKASKSEIDDLQRTCESSFEFKPTFAPKAPAPTGKARFVPETADRAHLPNVPKDDLPSVGKLYSHERSRQRFVAIERWEDLRQGEADAQRLNAKLVGAEPG